MSKITLSTLLLIFTLSACAQFLPPTRSTEQGGTLSAQFNWIYKPNTLFALDSTTKMVDSDSVRLLANPNFEAATVAEGWTYTPSGADAAEAETTDVLDGLKSLKITPAAETFTLTQTATMDRFAGSLTGINIWVKADFDMEACLMIGATEDHCSPVKSSSEWQEVEILGSVVSGSAFGIRLKSALSVTGTAFFDFARTKPNPLTPTTVYASSGYEQYTPTIQGMSGGSSISFFWKRVGDSIIIMADMTTGAPQSLEIQLGLPSGLAIDSSKVTTIMNVGSSEDNAAGTDNFTILATGGDSFLNMGVRGGGFSAGLTPQTDSTLFGSGRQINFVTQPIPITGWLDTNRGVVVKGTVVTDIPNEDTFSITVDNGAGAPCTAGTCTVNNEGLDWVDTVPFQTTGKYNVNFNSGVFTSEPNCHAEVVSVNVGRQCRVENRSTTTVTVECDDNSDAVENNVFTLICNRGDDKVLESDRVVLFPKGLAHSCSFKISATGVVSNQAGGCLSSCSLASTDFTCDFISNFWNGSPNCTPTIESTTAFVGIRVEKLDNDELDFETDTVAAATIWTCHGD